MYEFEDQAQVSVVVPSISGAVDVSFEVRREGQRIVAARHGGGKPWQLLLVNIAAVAAVEGGTAESTVQGTLVTPAQAADRLTIMLDA